MKAVCVLSGDVTGVIEFRQEHPTFFTYVTGDMHNLPKGYHGFHIHEFGDVTNGCTSAGEHFNPFHQDHGGPKDAIRHMGDLGNVYSHGQNTITHVDIIDDMITLYGPYNILGRSLVVHAMMDDYGRGDNDFSKITGNAGGRLGCGVIGVKSVVNVFIDNKILSKTI
uniref:superoxide dismutase n=1 Tax=Cnaphalocrocis medinalis granulovirus TaxID=1750712 RepID=A0A0X9IID2_9BBAC|nr:sod [Cnaphalocrocis medinalis granulovirus]WPN08659.1 sod [Cnaphalocrocis medinalis granulovirus]